MTTQPPTPRYRLTLTVTGNTLEEIEGELLSQTRGGFILDSTYYTRDHWEVWRGRCTSVMEHLNPEMTPEQYEHDLAEWFQARKHRKKDSNDL